jgi:acetylornithine/succinyldiaminopimelate/putrescine aminotransferase
VLFTTPFPFTIASAYGCTLKTVDGIEYIDFLGEYTAGIYGHNNPTIRKVRDIKELLSVRLQATRILSTSPGRTPLMTTSVVSRLSTKLSITAGAMVDRIQWKHSWHKSCASDFPPSRKSALSILVPKQT